MKAVKIGNQEWMAEDLSVTSFRNGVPIPQAQSEEQWELAAKEKGPAWCYSDEALENRIVLYNWYAANHPYGLAPEGWHVPSDKEWKSLEISLGMSQSEADEGGYNWRGKDEGNKLKHVNGWASEYVDPTTNASRFSALPRGTRDYSGMITGHDYEVYYWTSTEKDGLKAWCRGLHRHSLGILRTPVAKESGYCIRCVKD